MSVTCLLFVSTALTFWGTDYLVETMEFDKGQVTYYFVIITITAPLMGVIVSSILVQKLFGGYDKKHSILFVCCTLTISCFFIFPLYYINTLFVTVVDLWCLLFFGGAAVPILQGIVVSSLPVNLKAAGNGFCNLLIFCIGFSGGPFFYGVLYDHMKDYDKKLPFVLTIGWGTLSLVFGLLCAVFRYKKFNREEELLHFENEQVEEFEEENDEENKDEQNNEKTSENTRIRKLSDLADDEYMNNNEDKLNNEQNNNNKKLSDDSFQKQVSVKVGKSLNGYDEDDDL
jgi:MFS family permease